MQVVVHKSEAIGGHPTAIAANDTGEVWTDKRLMGRAAESSHNGCGAKENMAVVDSGWFGTDEAVGGDERSRGGRGHHFLLF